MDQNLERSGPPQGEKPPRNLTFIVLGAVALILLCCCFASLVVAWNYGDAFLEFLEQLSR